MTNTNQRARIVTIAIGLTLMAASAAVFAVTSSTSKVAGWSRELHRLDELQRLVESQRSSVGLLTHLAALRAETGWDLDVEVNGTLTALDSADSQIQTLVDAGPPIAEVEAFRTFVTQLTEVITGGDISKAQDLAETQLDEIYVPARDTVDTLRQRQLSDLIRVDEVGTRFGDVARLVVVLLVPVAIMLVYREIVERQLRQRQLEMQLEAEQQLAQARDEFVANASHELRTPLTGILGLSEVLVDDDRIPDDAREMLGMVTTEASDLARMVEDLLTTARLAAGQLRYEPRRVGVVEEAEVIVRPFLQAGRKIEVDVDDGAVYVDRLRQRQVLRNLISNAVKYGGDRIVLIGRSDGIHFRWTVADDGPGVPRELEERLFQRYIHTLTFQQAVAGGVGLGLSIVKSLAEGMGGSVSYRRRDGITQFIVTVPSAEGQVGARPSIHASGGVR